MSEAALILNAKDMIASGAYADAFRLPGTEIVYKLFQNGSHVLENDFQAELNVKRFAEAHAGIISAMQGAANEAEAIGAISESVVWRRQVQDIEHVEHFDAELRLYALRDRSVSTAGTAWATIPKTKIGKQVSLVRQFDFRP